MGAAERSEDAFYGAGIALVLYDMLASYWLESILGVHQPIEGTRITLDVWRQMIWIAYFLKSQRVRETFVLE